MGVWNIEARKAKVERHRRESRGVRCGEEVSPSTLEDGSGESTVPLPQKIV